MNVEKLSKLLFGKSERIYVVLDGASVPDLQLRLYEMRPPNICLYRGEIEPDIAEVAPYLVRIVPGDEFTNWILTEGWGKHWGIFAHSLYSLTEMRRHFRSFLTVHDESGKPLLFRYYDPRVLLDFLPTCNNEELATFFGRISNFAFEDKNSQTLINYYLQDNELQINRQSVE